MGIGGKWGIRALLVAAQLGCSTMAFAQSATTVPLPTAPKPPQPGQPSAAPANPAGTTAIPRPSFNPFGRTVTIDVQVLEQARAVGVLPLTITNDERLLVPVEELLLLLGDAITSANATALRGRADADGRVEIGTASEYGVSLGYDPARVALRLELTAAGDRRTKLSLLARQEYDLGEFVAPSSVSAYATFRTSLDYVSKGADTGLREPIVDALFALRAGGIVIEDEHSADFNRQSNKIVRLGTRAVYDVDKWDTRFIVGDTDIVTQGFQQGVGVFGLSAGRQYRTFEPQRNIRPRSLD